MKKVEYTLTLFDDDWVKEKLTVMDNMECLFDDARNDVPDEYYEMVKTMPFGSSLKITVELIN